MAELFLVLRQKPLLFASELIEALRFNDLAITCRMNVFSNCVKNQFAHSFAQFAMLTSISGDENEITLGFKQRSNVRDVAVKNVHVCVGQNQRIEAIFSSRLERFPIDKSTVFLSCGNHVHRQILIMGRDPFTLMNRYMATNFVANVRSEGLTWAGLVLHIFTVFS